MDNKLFYSFILLVAYFISAVSQVLLKKAAQKEYKNSIQEYLNFSVIFAYILFFLTSLMAIFAYKVIPLSVGSVLETTNYIWVTIFGALFFKEKISKRKIFSLCILIIGIVIYGVF